MAKTRSICILIQLQQDLDLLAPIIKKAISSDIKVDCLLYYKLRNTSPRMIGTLKELQVPFSFLHPKKDFLKAFWILLKCDSVVSAVETSARPHSFTHFYTRIANLLFKKTITMQHGMENIGLTYSDSDFPIKDVNISSKNILIWGDTKSLHEDIPKKTLQKCIPFGCPKDFAPTQVLPKFGEKTIAVFENLHWNRYPEIFRNNFINDFIYSAEKFPDVTFVIKPHHCGKWLTERSNLNLKFPKNVVVLNPAEPQWEPYTGPSIIANSDIVITTPSTIALDAAMMQKPTLIARYGLDLNIYEPLPMLDKGKDWENQIQIALQNPNKILLNAKQFSSAKNIDFACLNKINEILF